MSQKKLRSLSLFLFLLFFVMWVVISNAPSIDAETNITPTIIVSDRNFLPYIRGLKQGPTVTATLPPSTMTPWVTNTQTPTATVTETGTPSPSATNTPKPTATNTVPAPDLPAPSIHAIDNSDQDGNFTVAWAAVAGAEYYKLKQNYNDTTWDTLYEGPALSKNRSNMAPGEYCYRVRAFNSSSHSEWSADKCTTVMGEPEPEFLCEFETLYVGPRTRSDIELLHDGRVFITQTSEDGASIFDPKTRSFEKVDLPQGGGAYAAVLNDGNVVLTVGGADPHSMVYDPNNGEITKLNTIVNCLEVYIPHLESDLITYCVGNRGYVYVQYDGDYMEEPFDVEIKGYYSQLDIFINYEYEFRDYYTYQITNGITGCSIELDLSWPMGPCASDGHWADFAIEYGSASVMSYDKDKIYISGGAGSCGEGTDGRATTVKSYEADISDIYGYALERIADMWQDRQGHAMVATFDGNFVVLGGATGEYYCSGEDRLADIEIYVPTEDKWFKAGSMNIARSYHHQTIQLLNGEIFVYGGASDPGPGYGLIAPPEIGRCEQTK